MNRLIQRGSSFSLRSSFNSIVVSSKALQKRSLSSNVPLKGPEKPKINLGPPKPNEMPKAEQRGSWGRFIGIIGATAGAFFLLAVYAEEGNPTALRIADLPVISSILPMYRSAVRRTGVVQPDLSLPAKAAEPASGKSSKVEKKDKSSTSAATTSSPTDGHIQEQIDMLKELTGDSEKKSETDGSSYTVPTPFLDSPVDHDVPASIPKLEESSSHHDHASDVLDEALSSSSSTTVESYEEVTDRLANQIIDDETKHEIEQHRHDLEHPEEEQQHSHETSHHSSSGDHHVGGSPHEREASSHDSHAYSTSETVSHSDSHDHSSTPTGEDGALILPTVPAESIFRQQHTNEAVGEVLTNVSRNSIVLRKELEDILLKDIHIMDENSLRIRITQLVAELFERLSWESIRISQSVIQVEKDMNEKYGKLMEQQRKELEFEINKILHNREKSIEYATNEKAKEIEIKYHKELQETLKSQMEGFHNTLTRELTNQENKITSELVEQFNNVLANVQKSRQDELMAILPKVENLKGEITAFEKSIDITQEAINYSITTHAMDTVLLGLELILSSSGSSSATKGKKQVEKKLSQLKELSKNDELINSIIDSIPKRVQENGVLTLQELQIRFQILHEEVRKVALAPESAPKLIGQFIGSVLATISLTPKGNISGSGVEEVMARAAYHLERGHLTECLKELHSISGYSKVLIKDWENLANDRLIIDQVLQTLKADSLLRHKSFP
jgi:hypothetical protein